MNPSTRLVRAPRYQPDETDYPRLDGVERIVIVRDDRLGDFLVTLPAIAAIRQTYPRSEITLRVAAEVAPLARCVPAIDRVVTAGDPSSAVQPDLAVAISRDAATAWRLWRAGVRYRCGTARRWFSPLFTHRVQGSRRRASRHEVDHALQFAVVVGAQVTQPQFDLKLPTEAFQAAQSWLAERQLERPLLLHPGSRGSCPAWPVQRWCALIDRLRSRGIPLALTEGPADGAIVRQILASHPDLAAFRGSLLELGALTVAAEGLIGASTGPVHLAAALGQPTLALHAPWRSCAPERWAPYGACGFALVAEGPEKRPNRTVAERWLERLEPETVAATIDQLRAAGGGWIDDPAGVH